MELVVVIAILALIAGIVLPRLPSTESAKLRDSARTLASAIRFIGDRAATTKTGYRLHLNISDNAVWVRQLSASGEEIAADDPFLSRKILAEGIAIEDVTIPSSGKTGEGEVIIGFGPGGLQDFMLVHLKDTRDRHFSVIAYPASGKVKVEEGYLEEAK
jgi:general secretion pathway protein H